jgi:hypothetical protein
VSSFLFLFLILPSFSFFTYINQISFRLLGGSSFSHRLLATTVVFCAAAAAVLPLGPDSCLFRCHLDIIIISPRHYHYRHAGG